VCVREGKKGEQTGSGADRRTDGGVSNGLRLVIL